MPLARVVGLSLEHPPSSVSQEVQPTRPEMEASDRKHSGMAGIELAPCGGGRLVDEGLDERLRFR